MPGSAETCVQQWPAALMALLKQAQQASSGPCKGFSNGFSNGFSDPPAKNRTVFFPSSSEEPFAAASLYLAQNHGGNRAFAMTFSSNVGTFDMNSTKIIQKALSLFLLL